jgi:hypothetical protein
MLSEPRTYRYSTLRVVLLVILLGVLGVGSIFVLGGGYLLYALIFLVFIGLVLVSSVLLLTRSTTISNEGISVRSLLGERSLTWREIDSVSGRRNSIKLHNRDGDVTVNPSPHLPGYAEVIDFIGVKRPDLFDPAKYSVMSRNWLSSLVVLVAGVLFLGAGIYLYFETENTLMSILFLGFVALVFFVSIFLSVLSLQIDGPTLTVRYLLNRSVFSIDEVGPVGLDVRQTRYGKSYHVSFSARNRTVRFSGIGPSLPVVYLVLKNWQQGRANV